MGAAGARGAVSAFTGVPLAGGLYSLVPAAFLEQERIDERRFVGLRWDRLDPLFSELRAWLMAAALEVAPQSELGKAIAYAQGVYDRAVRFVEHAWLTPETNAIENAIRPFVVGRKNWLFSGSPLGAHASAGLLGLAHK